jgi:hypothetical protein
MQDVTVQASCLDPSVLGRLAAATQAVADAAQLHIKVLEDTLRQVPAISALKYSAAAAAAAAAGPGLSLHRPLQRAPDAGSELQLVVSGRQVGSALSDCWLRCLKAQADVDLAVVGLCNL